MNDGRRQLFAPPKQLLQPGAAARLPKAITRHRVRHMIGISTTAGPRKPRGRTRCVVRDDACQTLAHDPLHGRIGDSLSRKKFPGRPQPFPRPCRWHATVANALDGPARRPCDAASVAAGKYVLLLRTADESAASRLGLVFHLFGVCLASFRCIQTIPGPYGGRFRVLLRHEGRSVAIS